MTPYQISSEIYGGFFSSGITLNENVGSEKLTLLALLYIVQQTLIGLYIISFSSIVLIRFQSSLSLKYLNILLYFPAVTSEERVWACMLRHTKRYVINQSFLQHELFYHVCNRSLCIISVKSGLCCFSFARYLQKCVTQIIEGHKQGRRKVRDICYWVLPLKRKVIALETANM